MLNIEQAYLKLPAALQNLACSAQGWRIQRSRYDASFAALLAEAESRTFWTADQINDLRDRRLRSFVRHCEATVPYYRRRFKELGVTSADIRGLDDLRRLPILTKAEVQAHHEEFVSESIPRSAHVPMHTSGTTGGGLRFATTQKAIQEQYAICWRYRRWHGIALDTWCAYFGGRSVVPVAQAAPPFWRTNRPGRQSLFSAYHMNPKNLRAYAEQLRVARLPWLHGYPSLISLVASWIVENGFDLGYRPSHVTICSENLLTQQAELIERAFGVRPLQHYGMTEAVANISQCDRRALHVDEDFAVVEFVSDPAGVQKVVGTNFSNYGTPLLRYEVQDVVSVGGETCACGRPGRVIESVDGRHEDYVVLKNGARLGRLDHVFKDLVRVREAQLVQDRPGALVARIVRGAGYSDADEGELLQALRKRIGADTEVQVTYVSELPRSKTGKLRFVVSNLKDFQLENVARGSLIA